MFTFFSNIFPIVFLNTRNLIKNNRLIITLKCKGLFVNFDENLKHDGNSKPNNKNNIDQF